MALRIDDISINTILGRGTSLCGDIKVNGFVRVDGDIKGNLETDSNVIVGENSRVQGNVKSKSIIIGGIIIGNVFALDNVKILSGKNDEVFNKVSGEYLQRQAIKDRISV